jgi:hypothetical protein
LPGWRGIGTRTMRERGAMTQFNAELAELLRAKKYREATERLTELEQKGLNDVFPTLDTVASRVEASDRRAMLELLAITAGSLRWFDTLPQQTREALAGALEKMRNNLEEARGFLPRGRGEKRESDARRDATAEFFHAFAVEYARHVDGIGLEDATAKVAKDAGMNEWTVQAHWKRRHKEAKESLSIMQAMLDGGGLPWPTIPHRKKRQP